MSRKKISPVRRSSALLFAGLSIVIPYLWIVYFLKGSDLILTPRSLDPASEGYRVGIERISSTSDNLITIALAILGANVIWFLRDKRPGRLRHAFVYGIFLGCVTSIYFGIKLGFMAGLTLASNEPDIVPLLQMLTSQALFALFSGLGLSGLVVFHSIATTDEP